MTSTVAVVAVARTPFGRFDGALSSFTASDLGALAVDAVLTRSGVEPSSVDALYAGVGMIGAGVLTPTRVAVLASGLPTTTPSTTIDRACCSGMTAVGAAWKDIRLGLAEVVVCGGFESLSNTPFLWPRRRGARPGQVDVGDPLLLRADFLEAAIATYTGIEAEAAGVDRREQDEWALRSHERYWAAHHSGYFDAERFPVTTAGGASVDADESPRATTIERLAQLATIYDSPTVTAGNAPGLNDGAAMLVLTSHEFAAVNGLEPLAIIDDYAQVAGAPTSGTSTPAVGIQRLLDRADCSLDDIALLEINEAFAATPLVSTLRLGGDDRRRAEALRARTNAHGGAVAIGHPLGASGARITMTLVNGLRARGGGRGVAAICGGYGQGDALLLTV